jgi:hypothetical protein
LAAGKTRGIGILANEETDLTGPATAGPMPLFPAPAEPSKSKGTRLLSKNSWKFGVASDNSTFGKLLKCYPCNVMQGEKARARGGHLTKPRGPLKKNGATGIRTPDLLNAIEALYQLSYDP